MLLFRDKTGYYCAGICTVTHIDTQTDRQTDRQKCLDVLRIFKKPALAVCTRECWEGEVRGSSVREAPCSWMTTCAQSTVALTAEKAFAADK